MKAGENADLQSDANDVSGIFDHYCTSARTIWNTAFWPDPDFRNWDSIDEFHEVEKRLFQGLVLAMVDKEWPLQDLFECAIPFFQLVPKIPQGTPIMIQNPRPEAPAGHTFSTTSGSQKGAPISVTSPGTIGANRRYVTHPPSTTALPAHGVRPS